jgi:hypothetical protein
MGEQMTFRSILDPKFQYRNSASTDLAKTFERLRREQRQAQAGQAAQANAKVIGSIGTKPAALR